MCWSWVNVNRALDREGDPTVACSERLLHANSHFAAGTPWWIYVELARRKPAAWLARRPKVSGML